MTMISDTNKRLAKNTIYMYFRMVLVMGITLYTSRIVYKALGEEDFGIYSIVGGTIVFFTFLSNSLATALQRYLAFAIGEKNEKKLVNFFNQGFWTFCLISLVCIILCETIGLYLFFNYLDVPENKRLIAFFVFQLAILNLIVNLLRTPFLGLIISYERMNFFAIQGIVEVILKLLVAFAITLFGSDRLIEYMLLVLAVSLIINIYTILYCRKSFSHCVITFSLKWSVIKNLVTFSGWTVLTSSSNVLSNQGVSMVLNNIFGVIMSAAVGIANQIMSAIVTFLGSFQTAFNPQIVKSYASGNRDALNKLIFRMSLFSFYLMMVIGIPLILRMDEILNLWLTNVPQWTAQFSICIIIVYIIESYSGPFWMAMQAVGKIRNYQLIISTIISLNFIIAAVLLYRGFSPIWAYFIKIGVSIIVLLARVLILHAHINFSLRRYWLDIVMRSLICTTFIVFISLKINNNFTGTGGLIAFICIEILISILIIMTIGLPKIERRWLFTQIKNRITT